MSNFFKNLYGSDIKTSTNKIIFSLFAIIFIRIFLEHFSSALPSGYFFPWEEIFLHIPLYYFSTFFSFALLLYLLTKDPAHKIFTFLTKVFILMLIAPIVDLIMTHGQGSQIGFIITEAKNIPLFFIKLMNPIGNSGVTFGLHIASYFLISSFIVYIYARTKNIPKVLFGGFFSYLILFSYAVIPSLIVLPFTLNKLSPAVFTYNTFLNQSWISTTQEHVTTGIALLDKQLFLSNIFFAQLFFILLIAQLLLSVFLFNKQIWVCLKKCFRFERVLNYMLLAVVGILISNNLSANLNLDNPINITSLLAFFILIILNSILAVIINDESDIAIDTISHQERPLITKTVSMSTWKEIRSVVFFLLVFGTATLNTATAFLLVLTQAIYYLYSTRPFRLKKHFVTGSFSIGLATIFITMAGFFLVSPDQHFSFFPIKILLLVGISQAFISNMKDINDLKGDASEKIRTLPVVFGLKKSKQIIAGFFVFFFISLPVILSLYSFLIFSITCSFFAIYLFTKKQYREKHVFMLLFLYMFALFISLT